jgi:uncharacterized protein
LSILTAIRRHPFWTLAALATLGLIVCYIFGTMAARPASAKVPPLAANEQRFMLTASDGIKTAASYFPGAKANAPGVLLFHGVTASRNQFKSQITWLNAAGYGVLAIDFRGHGESAQIPRSFGLFEARDAQAAYDWLKTKQQGARIGAIGVSLGGAASLLGEKGPLPVDALILQAVYPDIRHAVRNRLAARTGPLIAEVGEPLLTYQSILRYGVWPERISPITAARRFRGAAFVIGGSEDRYTPVEETRALVAAFPKPAALWFEPGMGHDGVSATNTVAYQRRVLEFLSLSLDSPRTP